MEMNRYEVWPLRGQWVLVDQLDNTGPFADGGTVLFSCTTEQRALQVRSVMQTVERLLQRRLRLELVIPTTDSITTGPIQVGIEYVERELAELGFTCGPGPQPKTWLVVEQRTGLPLLLFDDTTEEWRLPTSPPPLPPDSSQSTRIPTIPSIP